MASPRHDDERRGRPYRRGGLRPRLPLAVLSQLFGLARSLILYRARPWKRRRLRAFYGQFVGPVTGVRHRRPCRRPPRRVRRARRSGRRGGAAAAVPGRAAAALWPPARGHVDRYGGRSRTGRGRAVDQRCDTHGLDPEPRLAERQSTARGFRHVRWNTRATVAVTTLDALIAAHGEPAFCKIDVEGSELAVLQGLSQPLAALSFEYTPAAPMDAVACVARLCTLGAYRFNASIGESCPSCSRPGRMPPPSRRGYVPARRTNAQATSTSAGNLGRLFGLAGQRVAERRRSM